MKTVEKRRMCPNCRAFITVDDRVCPYCGVQLGPRAVDVRASQFAASFVPQANLTSIVVLIINVTFFLIELIVSHRLTNAPFGTVNGTLVVALGGELPGYVHAGQWWRLITAGFLHGGLWHIAINSWSLFILVTEVEQFYGTSRFIVAYIFSTVTGFWLAYFFSSAALGASAAAFGLFGIMLAMGLRDRANPLSQAIRAHYGQWLVLGLVLSFMPGISLSAHVGGFIGGFLIGIAGGLPGLPNTSRELFWKILAGLAIAITLYAFLEEFLSYHAVLQQLSNT
ncbi:MAG: rhomboid family intramembrane serine protease [Acidobacteriaceae bacterium]|nr:rhomboid family intramembrane serine protease [Acidobacteriaceae bacterium]